MLFELLERRRLLSGLTIVTHGFNSNADDWVATMANAIASAAGGASKVSQYEMTVTNDSGALAVDSLTLQSGSPAYNTAGATTGQIVVRLDWGDVAGGSTPAGAVGDAVAAYLLAPVNRHLIANSIHLLGHSRGGSVITQIAQRFGERGVWVDQFTSQDPHPVDGIGADEFQDFGDVPMNVFSNVVFADNYYRQDGFAQAFDFDGEPVTGAVNAELSDSILQQAGYGGFAPAHSSVHLWYHGTIGPAFPSSDGDASVGVNWYSPPHPAKQNSGFFYSETIGGARPPGGVAASHGGTAARVSLTRNAAAQSPNIRAIAVSDSTISIGAEEIALSYVYDDFDSAATLTWLLDNDRNPHNGTAAQLPSTQSLAIATAPQAAQYQGPTTGLPTGTFNVLARIADAAGNLRFEYLPTPVTFVVPPPTVMSKVFRHDTAPTAIEMTFSANVGASLSVTDMLIRGPQGNDFNPAQVLYDPQTNVATFVLSHDLADGDYLATLLAAGVHAGGPPLPADVPLAFFLLRGDVNRDRQVSFTDLLTTAANFGKSPATYADGDTNADGQVAFVDLLSVAAKFGTSLPVQAPVAAASVIFQSISPIATQPTRKPARKLFAR